MNATGVTLSWEAVLGVLGIVGAFVGYIVIYIRNEARREYLIKAEQERNNDQDRLFAQYRVEVRERLVRYEHEVAELRQYILKNHEIMKRVDHELPKLAKRLDGLPGHYTES